MTGPNGKVGQRRSVDLNTLRRERASEPIAVTIGEETFEAPAELPFSAVEALGTMGALDPDDPKTSAAVVAALTSIMGAVIGPENWDRLREQVSFQDAQDLITALMALYGVTPDDAKEGEALGESQGSSVSS